MKHTHKIAIGMFALVAIFGISLHAGSAIAQTAPGSPEAAAIQQAADMARIFPGMVAENGSLVYSPEATQVKVGTLSTLMNVDSPYVNINGANYYYYNQPITASSSMPCSLKNPFGATSTPLYYSLIVTSNGLGAQNLEIATSSTNYGTSTPAFVYQYAAPAGQFNLEWESNGTTTSPSVIGMNKSANGTSDVVMGPSDYLNAKIASSTPGTFSSYYKGYCKALIRQM